MVIISHASHVLSMGKKAIAANYFEQFFVVSAAVVGVDVPLTLWIISMVCPLSHKRNYQQQQQQRMTICPIISGHKLLNCCVSPCPPLSHSFIILKFVYPPIDGPVNTNIGPISIEIWPLKYWWVGKEEKYTKIAIATYPSIIRCSRRQRRCLLFAGVQKHFVHRCRYRRSLNNKSEQSLAPAPVVGCRYDKW